MTDSPSTPTTEPEQTPATSQAPAAAGQPFSAPKGVPDYVPPASAEFHAVRDAFVARAHEAGYQHIELPVFEETGLYARGVGESTDVVSKEMYTFEDRGGRSVTLRPEGTAGVIRAVIEHNLDRGQLPAKLAYSGPFFRYERPQAGRYRQLQQVGVEAVGVDDPALDAEVIALADRCFRTVGLTGYRLELTSLGDATCRPRYRETLQRFLDGLPSTRPPAPAPGSTRCACSTTSAPRCARCSPTPRSCSTTSPTGPASTSRPSPGSSTTWAWPTP